MRSGFMSALPVPFIVMVLGVLRFPFVCFAFCAFFYEALRRTAGLPAERAAEGKAGRVAELQRDLADVLFAFREHSRRCAESSVTVILRDVLACRTFEKIGEIAVVIPESVRRLTEVHD